MAKKKPLKEVTIITPYHLSKPYWCILQFVISIGTLAHVLYTNVDQ